MPTPTLSIYFKMEGLTGVCLNDDRPLLGSESDEKLQTLQAEVLPRPRSLVVVEGRATVLAKSAMRMFPHLTLSSDVEGKFV
jgi:hypothetical protein